MFFQVTFTLQGAKRRTQVRLGLVHTSGKRFAWTYYATGGFMIGLNLIPGHFGLALDVQWEHRPSSEYATEQDVLRKWRLEQERVAARTHLEKAFR